MTLALMEFRTGPIRRGHVVFYWFLKLSNGGRLIAVAENTVAVLGGLVIVSRVCSS